MLSVFTSVHPLLVHLYVFSPFLVVVGSMVTVPLSHLCPSALTDSVFVSSQFLFVHLNDFR